MTTRSPKPRRRGATTVWAVGGLTLGIGFTALAVDLGFLYVVQADLQAAADSSALAGASELTNGDAAVRARAAEYAARNSADGHPVEVTSGDIELGLWNPVTRTFRPVSGTSAVKPDAVRVTARLERERGNAVSLFFARLFGLVESDVGASATAFFRSRDIMLVLDYSASMNDDSELRQHERLGLEAVVANLQLIWTELGSPTYGNLDWEGRYIEEENNDYLEEELGLVGVEWPYPGGGWGAYFNYVKYNPRLNYAGYRKNYGMLTLVNYWMEEQPAAHETPDLWRTSAQPITAVKDAVSWFLQYITQVETHDRVGLVAYSYTDSTAILEMGLTESFELIEDISRHRQAGHYDRYTNVGEGIKLALDEMEQSARPGAFKLMVLMTDGAANRPDDKSTARQYALEQAQRADDLGIPIVTISLGALADTSLMDDIAEMTAGLHFYIPPGGAVSDYEEDLLEVFTEIADHRPLKLVD